MAVSAKLVKELRERTGLGMMECKKALAAAEGDIDAAIEEMRKNSGLKAAKKAGADAIKLQTYTPDTITIDSDNEYFKINNGSIWDGKTYDGNKVATGVYLVFARDELGSEKAVGKIIITHGQ